MHEKWTINYHKPFLELLSMKNIITRDSIETNVQNMYSNLHDIIFFNHIYPTDNQTEFTLWSFCPILCHCVLWTLKLRLRVVSVHTTYSTAVNMIDCINLFLLLDICTTVKHRVSRQIRIIDTLARTLCLFWIIAWHYICLLSVLYYINTSDIC